MTLFGLTNNCSNPTRNKIHLSNDSIQTSDTHDQKITPDLQPLEAGEIHLTDEAFGNTIELTGIPLNFKEIIRPGQLLVKGNYLITKNIREDSLFMIFELPDLKCVSAFGIRGRGPDEFAFPKIVETTEDSILFYIYEINNEKVYKVSINKLVPEYYLTLPKHSKSLDDKQIVFTDNKSGYYTTTTVKGKMIYYFNKDSLHKETTIADLAIPGIRGSWTTFIGDFGVNKYYNRIAYAYKYYKRLRIIDITTLNERHIVFDAQKLDKGLNDIATLEPTNITHFWGISPKDNYFWMLYSGRTPIKVQDDNQNNNKYIFVEKYDWNGNPVKRYKLNDWGYFCIDDKNNTLFLASTASAFSVLKYDISDK